MASAAEKTAASDTAGAPQYAAASPITPTARDFWLFRLFPLQIMLPSGLLAAAGTVTVEAFGGPLAAVLGTGAGIFLIGIARFRGANIWRTLASRLAFGRRKTGGGQSPAEPFDVPVPDSGGAHYGMRWDGRCVVTMLWLDQVDATPTLLSPNSIRTGHTLPLPEVARCLSQFDIRLAAIDVITAGTRTPATGQPAQVYERLLGPLPAAAARSVWMVLRLDPLQNAKAIDSRGGGLEGTLRAATVATRRVANRLAVRGVKVRVLTAAQMQSAVRTLAAGSPPEQLAEERHALRHNDIALANYEIRANRIDTDVLARIWAVPTDNTTLMLRLRPAEGGPQGTPAGERPVTVSAMVRVDGPDARLRPAGQTLTRRGLRPLTGVQRRALLAGLAVAPMDTDPAGTARLPTPDALREFVIPVTGCGQLVGATDDGHGVAVPLFGPAVRQVEIIGDPRFAQQHVLRAVALGARVMVYTRQSRGWETIVSRVNDPDLLSLANFRAGTGSLQTANATVVVYDGVEPTGQGSDVTVMYLQPLGEQPQRADANVTLTQIPDRTDHLTVRTSAGTITARIVAIPAELEYLTVLAPAS